MFKIPVNMFCKSAILGAFATVATLAFAPVASATTVGVDNCDALGSSTSFDSFTSCQISGGGRTSQDDFARVNGIVAALFGDEAISLNAAGSFAARAGQNGTGNEFFGSRASDGFEIEETSLGTRTFNFTSLPDDTLFVSLKQGNGFELFRVPDGSVPFSLTHSFQGNSTSHISTFAGTAPGSDSDVGDDNDGGDPGVVPLPAAGFLLLGAFGALAAAGRRRRS